MEFQSEMGEVGFWLTIALIILPILLLLLMKANNNKNILQGRRNRNVPVEGEKRVGERRRSRGIP